MSIQMKRILLPILASAALIAILTGCTAQKGESQKAKRGMITATIYDRGNIPSSEGTIENNKITKWINEAGPVDVKFVAVPRTESEQKLNTLFAGGGAPDLILEYAASSDRRHD
jgi:putative aldouronate transport system substrate-binding protein